MEKKKKQIYIFLRCRSEFFFINKNGFACLLDADLNFSQYKNLFVSFLDTDMIFLIYANFEIKKKIKHDCICVCFIHVA